MTERGQFEQLLHELYRARVDFDLERLCSLFRSEASLRIIGTSDGKPIAMLATGIEEIRSCLAMVVKTFEILNYEMIARVIDGERAAVHWRAQIRFKLTGAVKATEFVDWVEAEDARIAAQTELFVPAAPGALAFPSLNAP